MGKYALLVGIGNYAADSGFKKLLSPVQDVDALQKVLINPEIGGFAEADVTVLKDAEKSEIEKAIAKLFAKRDADDLLLFYYSGHGDVDQYDNTFYLTGVSSDRENLAYSAIDGDYLHKRMGKLRFQRQVIILDCCHSGAITEGFRTKGTEKIQVLPNLGGEGRAILTAVDALQSAFERSGYDGLSIYTYFLVQGLRTGEADRDGDGHVSANELHEYVDKKVRSVNERMSPQFREFMKQGQSILLAKAVPPDDPKLQFRREVERVAKRSNGILSPAAQYKLNSLSQKLKIDSSETAEIIQQVLLPYVESARKLQEYERILVEMVAIQFPFSDFMQTDLEECENDLGLREADQAAIKDRILAPKQAEYEQQLQVQEAQRQEEAQRLRQQQEEAERQRQAAEAERLQRQQAEELRQQQEAAARRQREQEAAELEKQKQAILAAESLKLQQQKNPPQPEFTFEFVKVQVIKEKGFFGVGKETRIELEKKQGKADYIREDLGYPITLDLVRIPAGEFTMGVSPEERQAVLENARKHGFNVENNEQWLSWATPQHEVTVPEFWMGKYTVTNAHWLAVMETKPSEKYDVKFQGKKQPVVGVSWDDTQEFCKKLSNKLGRNIRLPSEAEWEYACRANTTTPFHFGETITTDLVNHNGTYPYGNAPKGEYRQKTVDVGSFSPNAFGLYDMHGNVWEWCSDRWHENYNDAPKNGSSWETGTVDNLRVIRGGLWNDDAIHCRSAYRSRNYADGRSYVIGFRLVVS